VSGGVNAALTPLSPKLLPGAVTAVTDGGVTIALKGRMGTVNLPLRSVFTDKPIAVGDRAELFVSCARIIS